MNTQARKYEKTGFDKSREYSDEVRRKAYGNWDQILMALGGVHLETAMTLRPGAHTACPRHGGVNNDAFRMFPDFRTTGGCVCNSCGKFNDGFATLSFLYGWTFREALRAVGDVLGVTYYKDDGTPRQVYDTKITMVDPPKQKSPAEVAAEDAAKASRLQEAWAGSFDLSDPQSEPARLYLKKRRLENVLGPLEDLRCHPGLPFFENKVNLGTYPALLCLLRQPDGHQMTIQRIYLTPEGEKVSFGAAKKMMPKRSTAQFLGSAVRLDHAVGPVLCVGEGVETMLAYRAMTGLPCWATCTSTLLETLSIPDQVKILIIAGDKDRPSVLAPLGPGQEAAEKLKLAVRGTGRRAAVTLPPLEFDPDETVKGPDWLKFLEVVGSMDDARRHPCIAGVRDQIAEMVSGLGMEWADVLAHY